VLITPGLADLLETPATKRKPTSTGNGIADYLVGALTTKQPVQKQKAKKPIMAQPVKGTRVDGVLNEGTGELTNEKGQKVKRNTVTLANGMTLNFDSNRELTPDELQDTVNRLGESPEFQKQEKEIAARRAKAAKAPASQRGPSSRAQMARNAFDAEEKRKADVAAGRLRPNSQGDTGFDLSPEGIAQSFQRIGKAIPKLGDTIGLLTQALADPTVQPDSFDMREGVSEKGRKQMNPAAQVTSAAANVGSYFVPGLGQAQMLTQGINTGGRIVQGEGEKVAKEMVDNLNIFDPKIEPLERGLRAINVLGTLYGGYQVAKGVSKAAKVAKLSSELRINPLRAEQIVDWADAASAKAPKRTGKDMPGREDARGTAAAIALADQPKVRGTRGQTPALADVPIPSRVPTLRPTPPLTATTGQTVVPGETKKATPPVTSIDPAVPTLAEIQGGNRAVRNAADPEYIQSEATDVLKRLSPDDPRLDPKSKFFKKDVHDAVEAKVYNAELDAEGLSTSEMLYEWQKKQPRYGRTALSENEALYLADIRSGATQKRIPLRKNKYGKWVSAGRATSYSDIGQGATKDQIQAFFDWYGDQRTTGRSSISESRFRNLQSTQSQIKGGVRQDTELMGDVSGRSADSAGGNEFGDTWVPTHLLKKYRAEMRNAWKVEEEYGQGGVNAVDQRTLELSGPKYKGKTTGPKAPFDAGYKNPNEAKVQTGTQRIAGEANAKPEGPVGPKPPVSATGASNVQEAKGTAGTGVKAGTLNEKSGDEFRRAVEDELSKVGGGKAYVKKYKQFADSLAPVGTHAQYRRAGLVTKDGDKYTLHMFAGTDFANWRVAGKVDVTDQFPSSAPANPVVDVGTPAPKPATTPTPKVTKQKLSDGERDYPDQEPGWFHGSSSPVELGSTYNLHQAKNLYGPGLYLTDNPSVAVKYTKKGRGGQPSLYRANIPANPKLIDLEKPLTPDVQEAFKKATGLDDLDFNKPGKDVYTDIKQNLIDDGFTRDEADDVLDGIVYNLRNGGYDGFSHVGGNLMGDTPHNVRILFGDNMLGKVPATLDQIQPVKKAAPPKVTAESAGVKSAGKIDATQPAVVGSRIGPGGKAEPTPRSLGNDSPAGSRFAASNAASGDIRAAMGVDKLDDAGKRKWDEVLGSATKTYDGDAIDARIRDVSKPLSDVETAQAAMRSAELSRKLKAATGENYDELETKLLDHTIALRNAGTEQGRALAARNMAVLDDYTLDGMYRRYVGASKAKTPADIPPDVRATIKKLSTEHEELTKRVERLQKGFDEQAVKLAEAERGRIAAEIKTRGARKAATKVTREELVSRIKKNQNQYISSVPIQGLIDSADDIKALVRLTMQDDITDLAEVYKAVSAQLKSAGVNLTRGEFDGVLAGAYKKTPGLKKDLTEYQRLLKEAKESGEAKDALIWQRVRRLDERIKAQQYDNLKETSVGKALTDAEIALKAKQVEFDRLKTQAKVKAEYEALTKGGKAYRNVKEVGNAVRSVVASTDVSAPLNQGFFYTLSHPGKSVSAMWEAMGAVRGDEALNSIMGRVRNNRYYDLARGAKLQVGGAAGEYADDFMTFGNSKAAKVLTGKYSPVGASERMYRAYVTKIRMDMFADLAKAEERASGSRLKRSDYEAIAEFVNTVTGTTTNRYVEAVSEPLGAALFAPKYTVARIKTAFATPAINAARVGNYRLAGRILAEYLKVGAAIGGAVYVANKNGANVEMDPRSPKFMKGRIGNVAFDADQGLGQTWRLVAGYLNPALKRIPGLPDAKGDKSSNYGVLENFFSNKLAPVPKIFDSTIDGKAYGKSYDVAKQEGWINIGLAFLPISAQNGKELYARKDISVEQKAAIGLAALLGVKIESKPPRE